jgi:MFS transporter, DHA1 family, inner membrane transport protein
MMHTFLHIDVIEIITIKGVLFHMSRVTQRLSPGELHPDKINPRIFLLALGMFALGTDAFVVAGVLPVIAKETGVAEGLAGQLVTVFALTYGLGAPILAALTSRWSRNRVLIGAIGLFCLANVGSALAPTFSILMLTRILAGCFAATFAPLAYTVGISLAPPAKRGQALAMVVIGLTLATVLGSPLGTWVGEQFGWRFAFGLVVALAGIAFLAILLCGLPKAEPQPSLSLKARLAPIAQTHVILTLLPAFLWNLGLYMVYTYIALLLQKNMHIIEISGLLVIIGLGSVIGNWSGGLLADRFGPNRPLAIFLVLFTIMEAILSLTTRSLIGGGLTLFVWGLTSAMLFIPQQHRLLNAAPSHANVILALNNSVFYLGIAAGAALGGLALHAVDVTRLSWIGACFTLAALLLFTFSTRLHSDQAPVHENGEVDEMILLPE